MDTRSKILTLAAAREIATRPIAIVTGAFDVLRVAHARELQQARERTGAAALLAIVLPQVGELLPQRARCELVAALAAVDHVAAASASEAGELIEMLRPIEVVRLEEADERRSTELRQHILSRTRKATMV